MVEVVGLVRNLPQNQDGDRVAAPATLTSTTGTIDASVDVEVVEPDIVLDKMASHQARFHGEVVTYTTVVRNAGAGPAFDLDIGDTLPAGIRLVAGSVSLAGVTGTVLETGTGFDATLARLMPGETATLTYKATVMYAARGGDTLFNDATVTASSIPEAERDNVLAALPGRTAGEVVRGHDAADRVGTLILVPSSELSSPRAVSGLIDDERFMPLISLNPFFSGTAEYGSHVTITLRDSSGAIIGTRGGFADAGGNWVASFPLSTIEIEHDLERDRDTYFVTSRLFSDNQGMLGSHSGSLARSHWADREVFVGTRLLDQAYSVEVHQDLASYNAGLDGAFNARAYFTPVITNEVFGQERQLDIQKVFEGRAEFALDQLYEASLSPLGMGGNRYTSEFLAIAGSASGR